jgi:hypothetical protein
MSVASFGMRIYEGRAVGAAAGPILGPPFLDFGEIVAYIGADLPGGKC